MKKISYCIAAVCCLMAAASCQKSPSDDRRAVRFASDITRASGTEWAEGDKVGVFMITGTTLSAATISQGADNCLYLIGADKTTLAPSDGTQKIYYPVTGSVNFIAYYPYVSTLTLHEYPVVLTDQSDPTKIDFMAARTTTAVANSSTAVNLVFKHMLSRLIITAEVGDGLTKDDLTKMTVEVAGLPTKARYNFNTGTYAVSLRSQFFTRTITAGAEYEAFVMPGTVGDTPQANAFFYLNNGPGGAKGDAFTWKIPATVAFEAGKTHTWEITVKRSGVTVKPGTITDWDPTNLDQEDIDYEP